MTPQRLFDFLPLAVQSLTQPRVTLRQILAIPFNRSEIILAAWLVIVLNLAFSTLFEILAPVPDGGTATVVPLGTSVVVLALTMFGGAFVMYRVGRAFGGTGSFDDSLKTIIWLNFVVLLVQIAIPIVSLLSAEASGLVILLVFVIAMVQITALVMELHGFTKVMPVLLGIIGAQLVFGALLLVVLGMMGVTVPMESVS